MHWWWDGGAWGVMPLIMGLLWVSFWVVIVYVVLKSVRRRDQRPGDAVRILEERYARGEISREEFVERRSVLEQYSRPPRP